MADVNAPLPIGMQVQISQTATGAPAGTWVVEGGAATVVEQGPQLRIITLTSPIPAGGALYMLSGWTEFDVFDLNAVTVVPSGYVPGQDAKTTATATSVPGVCTAT
jgi:hypothetical protein